MQRKRVVLFLIIGIICTSFAGIAEAQGEGGMKKYVLKGVRFSDGGRAHGSFEFDFDLNTYQSVEITIDGNLFGNESYTFNDKSDQLSGNKNYIDICEGNCAGGSKYFRFTFKSPLDPTKAVINIKKSKEEESYYGKGWFYNAKGLTNGHIHALKFDNINATKAFSDVTIVYPIHGETYPNADMQNECKVYSYYQTFSFSVTCSGGSYDVKWGVDNTTFGNSIFYDQVSKQFTYKLPNGTHVFWVDAGSCGEEKIEFEIK